MSREQFGRWSDARGSSSVGVSMLSLIRTGMPCSGPRTLRFQLAIKFVAKGRASDVRDGVNGSFVITCDALQIFSVSERALYLPISYHFAIGDGGLIQFECAEL